MPLLLLFPPETITCTSVVKIIKQKTASVGEMGSSWETHKEREALNWHTITCVLGDK